MMDHKNKPLCPRRGPYSLKVEEGETYLWCACGRSETQPFCDGSHEDTNFTPVTYMATKSRHVFFCGCKATKREPFCDGEHAALKSMF